MPRKLKNESARSGTIIDFLKFFVDCSPTERQRIFAAVGQGTVTFCLFPVAVPLGAKGDALCRLARQVAEMSDSIDEPKADSKVPTPVSDAA